MRLESRPRRACPRREVQLVCDAARTSAFVKPHSTKRLRYAGFFRGLEPGAVVAEIVAVGAFNVTASFHSSRWPRDVRRARSCSKSNDPVGWRRTAGRPSRSIGRRGGRRRFRGELPLRHRALRWQRRRDGGHAIARVPSSRVADGEHEGAVDAARVAHESRSKLAHVRGKSFELGLDAFMLVRL